MKYDAKVASNGTSIIVPECPKCGKRRAHGVQYIREMDGRQIFRCDHCGQERSLGWDETHHLMMVKAKEDHENAFQNRERWRREFTEKFSEDYQGAIDNVQTTPDAVENFNAMLKGPQLERKERMPDNGFGSSKEYDRIPPPL